MDLHALSVIFTVSTEGTENTHNNIARYKLQLQLYCAHIYVSAFMPPTLCPDVDVIKQRTLKSTP